MRGSLWAGITGTVMLTACAAPQESGAPPSAAPLSSSEGSEDDVPREAPAQGGVSEGELALTLGDPVRAIQILQSIPAEDSTYAYAQELLVDAKADSDALVDEWLEEVDTLIAIGRFRSARARCKHLLESFPIDDAQRQKILARGKAVDSAVEEAKARLDVAENQARDLILSNDLPSALVTLRGARDVAWEIDRARALRWERMIALTDLRYKDALAEGLVKNGDDGRGKARRRKVSPTSVVSAPPAAPTDPEELRRKQEVQTLLQEAASAAERQSHFEAIQTYERVLKRDANNAAAVRALGALSAKRAALIGEYLAQADQFFLRQDLESAVPYYQKVLALQPEHKRALEGLRMHENLQKIKGKKSR